MCVSVGWHRRVKCVKKAFPDISAALKHISGKHPTRLDRAWYQECGDRWYEETRVWICKVKSIRQMDQGNASTRKKQYLEFLMLGKQCIRIISKNCEKVNPRQMLEDLSFKSECSFLRNAESLLILEFNIRDQFHCHLLLSVSCVPN